MEMDGSRIAGTLSKIMPSVDVRPSSQESRYGKLALVSGHHKVSSSGSQDQYQTLFHRATFSVNPVILPRYYTKASRVGYMVLILILINEVATKLIRVSAPQGYMWRYVALSHISQSQRPRFLSRSSTNRFNSKPR
jgi:hypothetical protein